MSAPEILSKITSQDGTLWEVSGSNGAVHIVAHDWDGWMCTCPDHYYRKSFCKHMQVCAENESMTSHTGVSATIPTLDKGAMKNGCH